MKLLRLAGVTCLGLSVMCGQSACSSSDPDVPECDRPHPAFRLVVDAGGQPVPEDVLISVQYGGGIETFRAVGDNLASVVLCEVHREQADDEQGPIEEIACDLWTSGAATVSVTAIGYVDDVQDLEAEKDPKCGILLSNVRITLVQNSR